MCGLVGIISNYTNGFSNEQMDLLGENLIINQFRGTDSTGLFVIDKDGGSFMHKVVGDAKALFSSEGWEPLKSKIYTQGVITIGHGRAATRGTVTVENAHPFAKNFPTGEVLKLVHNGTLDYFQSLPDFHKFVVDSEWIAEMMVRYGPDEALSKIKGAMALIWWNGQEKTLNFFRNNERPLHFGRFRSAIGEDTIIINSEAAGVEYLASRHKLKTTDPKGVVCFYFQPNKHYVLSFEDLFGDFSKVTTITPEKDTTYAVGRRSWSNYTPSATAYRSLDRDAERIMSGEYKSVVWKCQDPVRGLWTRITKLWNDTELYEVSDNTDRAKGKDVSPYYTGLKSMIPVMRPPLYIGGVEEEAVEMKYEHTNARETHSYTTYMLFRKNVVPFDKEKAAADCATLINGYSEDEDTKDAGETDSGLKDFVEIGVKKFRPNRRIRFTTRSRFVTPQSHGVIRHKAIVAERGGPTFSFYENPVDGVIKIGDTVVMEVNHTEETFIGGVPMITARGFRLKPDNTQDEAVEIALFTGDKGLVDRLREMDKEPFYSGTVQAINLANQDRFDDDGVVITVFIGDVSPLEWDDALSIGKPNAQSKSC